MELQAVIAGLSALKEQCVVKVVTDSQYVQRAMTRHLVKWCRRNWHTSRGVPVSNRDLWEALLRESRRHKVTWTWIRGHGASAEQNRCDALAQAAARRLLTLRDGVFGGYSRREMRRKIREFRLLAFAENPSRLSDSTHERRTAYAL